MPEVWLRYGRVPSVEPGARRSPHRGDEDEAEQADASIDEHDRRRQRFRTGRRRRIGNPHHIAADIAGQKVVEERGDEERRGQRAEREMDVLSAEKEAPAPGTDQNHQ